MGRVNKNLLERLKQALGLERAAVYARLQKIMNETHIVDLDIAALALARRAGINISRYSTREQRAQLAGGLNFRNTEVDLPNVEHPVPKKKLVRAPRGRIGKPPAKTVFVVHGRDKKLTDSMYAFLGALKLEAVEWNQAVRAASKKVPNPYVGDIISKALNDAGAIVVLFSPDDEAKLHDNFVAKNEKSSEGKLQGQARANVLFEAGLALSSHPRKTLFVEVGKIKPYSDVGGKHILRLNDSAEARSHFADRLDDILGSVDRSGTLWLSVGSFVSATQAKPQKGKR